MLFPLRDHRFDEVLLLGLDLFHVQANGLLGFLFGRDIRDLDFMGDAFGRQQARQFGACIRRFIAVPSILRPSSGACI